MQSTEIQAAKPFEQHRFHFLDLLRGLAAVIVVPRHATDLHARHFAFFSSYLAVDFFFCLSGFVIGYSYDEKLKSKLSFKGFALTRVIRLYPLAILGTLIGALQFLFGSKMNLDQTIHGHHIPVAVSIALAVIAGLLVLPLPAKTLFPIDQPMWTLFFELLSNLAYGALAQMKLQSTRVLGFIIVCSSVLLIFVRLKFGTLDLGYGLSDAIGGLARVGTSFFLGICAYRLYAKVKLPKLSPMVSAITTVVVCAAFFGTLCNSELYARSAPFELASVFILFPACIFAGAHVATQGVLAAVYAFLGLISYPLYILHQPVLLLLSYLRVPEGIGPDTLMATYLVMLITLSWALAKFYDAPVRSILTQRMKKLTAQRMAS